MDYLEQTVKDIVFGYAGGGPNILVFAIANPVKKVYAVLVVDHPIRKQPAGVMIMARIIDDRVVIEEDMTDKPLIDKLLDAGIPREQIIKAYAGERLPDPVQS